MITATPPLATADRERIRAAVDADVSAQHAAAAEQADIDRAAILGDTQTVRLRDGTSQEVTLRVLSIRELPRYVALRFGDGDEVAALELVCGQAQGWGDTVVPVDQLRLLARANELNFPLALQWMQDQVAMLESSAAILGRAATSLPSRSGRPAPGSATSSASR